MIDVNEIHSLSEFQRNSKDFIRKLKRSGKAIRGIGRGLEQAKRGEGRPMRALLEEIAVKHGIALK